MAITANELRIGNWVNNNEEYYQITSSTIAQLERGDSNAKSIPINEDWLLKFGFTQSPAFKNIYFKGTFLNITLGNKIMFEINDQIISEIKYIHQLQNLYFALTGKELKYGNNPD